MPHGEQKASPRCLSRLTEGSRYFFIKSPFVAEGSRISLLRLGQMDRNPLLTQTTVILKVSAIETQLTEGLG